MGGLSKIQGAGFAEKIKSPQIQNALMGPDFVKNTEFLATHPDSAPPAKGQSYDNFTKAYGDAHPIKAEPAQGLPAPSSNTPAAPSTPQAQQPTTYSAPQPMIKAPAASAAAPMAAAATTTPLRAAPQAAQIPQAAQAARAANQLAGINEVKQFSLPNVGQISFGGS